MTRKILDSINTPAQLKALPESDIPTLCREIREFLIEKVGATGGHLASNLGVVELTVAMHRVFDSPHDHFVFDVGHQSYVHKMLTERREGFDSLRKPGGLLGFTSIFESEYDVFGAGHSSTAISAGLGLAEADRLSGSNAATVCVVGDGAYTGGMAHEALNNVDPELPIIIILNENGMSISQNKGAFAGYLSRVRISARYVKWKEDTRSFLKKLPLGGAISRLLSSVKGFIKRAIYPINYFEELGLYYLGGIDGNDYNAVSHALLEAKRLRKAVVVHIRTQKGMGHTPAEKSPDEFHSLPELSRADGERPSSVFGSELIKMAESDERTVAVTAAMGIGTGLTEFAARFPERYYDVGIAEGHALTFSAGLARAGCKPYCAIYSTFLQRGYDSIIHDIALQRLPVRIMIDRAGLSVSDGATHHGIFDVSFLSHIPNIELYAPSSHSSLKRILAQTRESQNPVAIRYANAPESETVCSELSFTEHLEKYFAVCDFDAEKEWENIIITYGRITENVLTARDILAESGIFVGVVCAQRLKPIDGLADFVTDKLRRTKRILFVEEGIKNGGFAMLLRDELLSRGYLEGRKTAISAIDDTFVIPSEPCDLYELAGLSSEKIAKKFIGLCEKG